MKILLVDDRQDMRETMSDFLQSHGFEVTTAVDGQDGLETFNKDAFAAVVSDYDMPVMDGGSLLTILRGKGVKLPLYLFTGNPLVNCEAADRIFAKDQIHPLVEELKDIQHGTNN